MIVFRIDDGETPLAILTTLGQAQRYIASLYGANRVGLFKITRHNIKITE